MKITVDCENDLERAAMLKAGVADKYEWTGVTACAIAMRQANAETQQVVDNGYFGVHEVPLPMGLVGTLHKLATQLNLIAVQQATPKLNQQRIVRAVPFDGEALRIRPE